MKHISQHIEKFVISYSRPHARFLCHYKMKDADCDPELLNEAYDYVDDFVRDHYEEWGWCFKEGLDVSSMADEEAETFIEQQTNHLAAVINQRLTLDQVNTREVQS